MFQKPICPFILCQLSTHMLQRLQRNINKCHLTQSAKLRINLIHRNDWRVIVLGPQHTACNKQVCSYCTALQTQYLVCANYQHKIIMVFSINLNVILSYNPPTAKHTTRNVWQVAMRKCCRSV